MPQYLAIADGEPSSAREAEPDDEIGVARAIRDGSLPSPQTFHNMALFALRITGTGAAYRRQLKEYVWRDPSIYLTDEFLARCNGLPVIIEHPPGKAMTSDDFQERVIGTILLPYVEGDEVWGIAKIFDETAIAMMVKRQLSTSPGVVFRDPDVNTTATLQDGSFLLIEGKPSLLDHLAICEQGVWDKGGSPAGVRTTMKDTPMSDEEKAALAEAEAKSKKGAEDDRARKDAEASAKLDRILSACDSFGARLDALESTGKRDAEKAEAEAKEPPPPAPKAEETPPVDNAKKDDEDTKKKEAEAKTIEREDAARKDAEAMRARVDEMERRIPKERSDADAAGMAEQQARADRVHSAFGDSAPRPLAGEDLLAYRRRLATGLQVHSKPWAGVNLHALGADVLGPIEAQIYADAMTVATHPVDLPDGMLREHIQTDSTGRRISTFYGEPRAWMSDFAPPRRRLVGIRTATAGRS